MKLSLRDATIAAVAYADIFDYPLMDEELFLWIAFVKRPRLAEQGEALRKFVQGGHTYYSLRSAKRLVSIRTKRQSLSVEKWVRARRVAKLLKLVPTIRLVGVTGGLARSNAKAEDDIDFLIITAPKTLWVTRALATMLLGLFHLRRRPGDTHFRNLICLNMFMSEEVLAVPKNERDLFAAHEVLQMQPLWERGGAYRKFLTANRWVRDFLPNAWEERQRNYELRIMNYGKHNLIFPFILHTSCFMLRLMEPIAKFAQLRYMNKRRTTEIVSDTLIRFHPRDARVWVRLEFGKRLAKLKIPLDKIWELPLK